MWTNGKVGIVKHTWVCVYAPVKDCPQGEKRIRNGGCVGTAQATECCP